MKLSIRHVMVVASLFPLSLGVFAEMRGRESRNQELEILRAKLAEEAKSDAWKTTGPFPINGKTYEIKSDDLWVSEGGKREQIDTDGKIKAFSISQSGKFVACQKFIKEIDEYSDDTDESPAHVIGKRDFCSIVIVDLKTKKIIRELHGKSAPFGCDNLSVKEWDGDDHFHFYGSNGTEAIEFVHEVSTGRTIWPGNFSDGSNEKELGAF